MGPDLERARRDPDPGGGLGDTQLTDVQELDGLPLVLGKLAERTRETQ